MKSWKIAAIAIAVIFIIVLLLASFEFEPHEHTDAELAKGCNVPVAELAKARKTLKNGQQSSITFGRCTLTKIAGSKLQLEVIESGQAIQ